MKVSNREIISSVEARCAEILLDGDCVLYGVEIVREFGMRILRVYVEGEKVGLDECQHLSMHLSNWLDEVDIIPFNYSLEVSTPGVDRPLKLPSGLKRATGKLCKITVKKGDDSGRKNYTGRVLEVSDLSVVLFVKEENKKFAIEIADIAKARLEVEF